MTPELQLRLNSVSLSICIHIKLILSDFCVAKQKRRKKKILYTYFDVVLKFLVLKKFLTIPNDLLILDITRLYSSDS